MERLGGTIPISSDSQVPYSQENNYAPLSTPADPNTASHFPSPGNSSPSTGESPLPNGLHICIECDKSFPTKNSYDKHYRTHNPPISCPRESEGCSERFTQNRELERHILVHHRPLATEDNPQFAHLSRKKMAHKCECGHKCDRGDNMKRHKKKCRRRGIEGLEGVTASIEHSPQGIAAFC
ncbi:hypothetical protein F5883DRAFT_67776 [Diaporthe sp. PMI_573]|nr:hypothetical protein F5883DRAFT_67776 [Diaporthaceae sp. PMI_573]